ncbi:putative peptidoglycan binding protein [Prosthecobacter fusiformis]|uniref:Putative peptidoglycan binding protein n=1 Tax=Prosthecobacter fusiformis TaxID=48464 RepID=A0A4R7SQ63_9BACT|nr:peptidoglycan-binding protein [Prosthecobacter fusiformis]TDU80775.1 putative peptidoglycan binding protein [Prosthecobacter fusiformis]
MDTALPAPKSADTPLTVKVHRYPGTRAFQDKELDRRLFTGRDTEIRELCQRILSHRIVVLYATSGTGKSSLLKAGVFPELRARGYLPLDVRFDFSKECTLGTQLDKEVRRECARPEQAATLIDAPSDSPTFEHYFDQAEFWGTRGPMVPVLVLDQFEDVFKRHKDPKIAKQIAQAQAVLFKEIASLITSPRDMRLVLSLREDAIGTLLAMGHEIPGLTHHNLQLLPLSAENAIEAIKLPATKDFGKYNALYTPPFECDDDAVRPLTNWLAEKSRAVIKDTMRGEGGGVETFVLQIFCEHIEAHAIREIAAGRTGTFTTALFEGKGKKEAVLRDYYHGKLLRFLVSRTQEEADKLDLQQLENRWLLPRLANRFMFNPMRSWRVLNLLERDLLTSDGGRRPARRDEIMRLRGLQEWEVVWLEAQRLVRSEPFGGQNLLNLSHDQLAAAIHERSLLRFVRRQLYVGITITVAFALCIVAALWVHAAQIDAAKERIRADHEFALRTAAAEAALERAGEQTGMNALATLAAAVKTLPSDDTAFFHLVDAAMSEGISIPLGYRQLVKDPGAFDNGRKTEILPDVDGNHFGHLRGAKLEVISLLGSDEPRMIHIPPDLSKASFALGNGGKAVVAINKRSATKAAPGIGPSERPVTGKKMDLHIHQNGILPWPKTELPPISGDLHELMLSPRAHWLIMADRKKKNLLCCDLQGHPLPLPLGKKAGDVRWLCFPKQDDIVVAAIYDSGAAPDSEFQSTSAFVKRGDNSEWLPLKLKDVRVAEFSMNGGWLAVVHGHEISFFSRTNLNQDTSLATTQTFPLRQILPVEKEEPRTLNIQTLTFFENDQRMIVSGRMRSELDYTYTDELYYFSLRNEKWQVDFSTQTQKRDEESDLSSTKLRDLLIRRIEESTTQLDRPTRWQFDPSGRWASTPTQIIDLLGDRSPPFSYPWQSIQLEEEDRRPRMPPNLGNWLSPTLAPPPLLRLLEPSGAYADWRLGSVPILRPSLRLLGKPERKARIAPDRACLIVWDEDRRWTGTANIQDQSAPSPGIILPEGWTVLNITAAKYLLAYSESSNSLQVWDVAIPEAPLFKEEIKLSTDINIQPSRDNALVNVAGDRIFIADTLSRLFWQFAFASKTWTSQPAERVLDLPHGWILQSHTTESEDEDSLASSMEYKASIAKASTPDKPLHVNLRSGYTHLKVTPDGRGLIIVYPETSKSTSGRRNSQLLLRHYELTPDEGLKDPQEWLLNGDAEVDDIMTSPDLRWCTALINGSTPKMWDLRLPASNQNNGRPALPLGEWSIGSDQYYFNENITKRKVAIIPERHELVIEGEDKVFHIPFSEWRPGTTPEELADRINFADLVSTLTSEQEFRTSMRRSGAISKKIIPGEVLLERYGKDMSNQSLAKVTAWLMNGGSVREHPFTTRPIGDWIAERLTAETIDDTIQAYRASPSDPKVLRALGKLLFKESGHQSSFTSEACFTFARENSSASEHAEIDAEWAQVSQHGALLLLDKIFQGTEYSSFRTYSKMKVLQQVQKRLGSLGYYQGAPDGRTDSLNHAAIVQWQASRGQPPTGLLSTNDIKQLGMNNLLEQHAPALGGKWLGTYYYGTDESAAQKPVEFKLTIQNNHGDSWFTGIYTEPYSGFGSRGPDGQMHGLVSGSIIDENGKMKIQFNKTYRYFHQPPIVYEGTLNPDTGKAYGNWGGKRGTFTLERQP